MREHALEPVGEPVWARYDPPFMRWFSPRNEILIEVQLPSDPGFE